jgi:hypothetical protein
MLVAASPWQLAQDCRAPGLRVPQRLAVLHPQHARVLHVVALHRLGAGLMNSKPERRASSARPTTRRPRRESSSARFM